MTRYFEVKVAGCCECPCRSGDRCYHYALSLKSNLICEKTYEQNRTKLTPTCPMWDKTTDDKE